MKIITNNQYRPILNWHELTEAEQKELDMYEDVQESSFFRYRKWTYDLCDFWRTDSNDHWKDKWDGYKTDSYFSAILVKYSECGEALRVGLAIC
jgi:hypothetical protein